MLLPYYNYFSTIYYVLLIIVGLLYCAVGFAFLEDRGGCLGILLKTMVPWSYIIFAMLFTGIIWRSHVYVVTGENIVKYQDNILLWNTKYIIKGKEYKLNPNHHESIVINEYKKDVVVDEKKYSIVPITFDQLKHVVIKPDQIQYFNHNIDYLGEDAPSSISSSNGNDLSRYQLHEYHEVNAGS